VPVKLSSDILSQSMQYVLLKSTLSNYSSISSKVIPILEHLLSGISVFVKF